MVVGLGDAKAYCNANTLFGNVRSDSSQPLTRGEDSLRVGCGENGVGCEAGVGLTCRRAIVLCNERRERTRMNFEGSHK